jgi:hypothetical protein
MMTTLPSPIIRTVCRTSQTAVASIPRPGGCQEYMRCFLNDAHGVCSHVRTSCLTTCKAAIWQPGIALNPSGFAPEFARSVSTCDNSAFMRCIALFYHNRLQAERGYITMDDNTCQHFERLVPTRHYARIFLSSGETRCHERAVSPGPSLMMS